MNDAPVIVVSSDCHIGPRLVDDLRPYCPTARLGDFDDFVAHTDALRADIYARMPGRAAPAFARNQRIPISSHAIKIFSTRINVTVGGSIQTCIPFYGVNFISFYVRYGQHQKGTWLLVILRRLNGWMSMLNVMRFQKVFKSGKDFRLSLISRL